jgi:hypothetical protein
MCDCETCKSIRSGIERAATPDERIAALEAVLESVLKVADRDTDVFNKARAVLKNTQVTS